MRMFADQGYAGTSMRAVAAEAGVSIGLVQHHFGTKNGLRDACDEVAIGAMLEDAAQASGCAVPFAAPTTSDVDGVMLAYLGRALIDGSPTAATLFDAGTDLAESWLRTSDPERFAEDETAPTRVRATAALMGAMHLGPIALHAHLSRRLGGDVFADAETIPTAMTEVYRVMAKYSMPGAEGQNG